MKRYRPVLKLMNLFLILILFSLFSHPGFSQDVPLLEWAKAIGGQPNYSVGDGIALDAAGNVYTTGKFYSTADFDPGPGTFNMTAPAGSDDGIYISKLSSTGDFVWAKSINSIYNDARGIAVDGSGNVLITGFYQAGDIVDFDPGPGVFNLTSTGNYDMFILKLDANGDFVWAKRIGGVGSSSTSVFGNGIALDHAGNAYVTGDFIGTIDFDPGAAINNLVSTVNRDIYVCKIDANGNFVWARTMAGFKGCACDDAGSSIAVDDSGNVYTTGFLRVYADFDPGPATFTVTPPSGGGIFVSKLDTDGNFVWAQGLGGNGSSGTDLSLDAAGNVYTTGYAIGTSDFDPGAGTSNLISAGSYDVFVSKLDNNGTFVWAKSLGSTAADFGQGIDVDASGNVYINGEFNNTVDFDPGPGTFNLTGSFNYFIQKLDVNGDFVWARSIATQGNGSSIVVESSMLYVLGSLTSTTADFDPGACFFNPTSVSSGSSFIQKLRQGTAPPGPAITSFTPAVGLIGTSVTITGNNFSTTPTENVVRFFNNKTASVTASTATSITTSVPVGTITGKISVTTNCITATSLSDFVIGAALLPTITSFTPSAGVAGTTVTITGTNFSTTATNNTVKFNGTTAVVSASTATGITVTVPANATTGKITVTVTGNTATSATDFTVTTNPVISITIQPSPASVCNGAAATFTTAATGASNIAYQWQFATALSATFSNISNGGGYANTTTASLSVNTTGNFGAGFYRCRISGDLATTVSTNAAQLTITTCDGNQPPEIQPTTIAAPVNGMVTLNLATLLSDPDDNLDLSTLKIITAPSSGARALITEESALILDYTGISFSGTERLTIEVCDLSESCAQKELTIEVAGDVIVYNAISPNGDGKNDFLFLQHIDLLNDTKENHVTILNRWGSVVWEGDNYNNTSVVFSGLNKNGNDLPSGNYFYRIEFGGNNKTYSGFLTLKR